MLINRIKIFTRRSGENFKPVKTEQIHWLTTLHHTIASPQWINVYSSNTFGFWCHKRSLYNLNLNALEVTDLIYIYIYIKDNQYEGLYITNFGLHHTPQRKFISVPWVPWPSLDNPQKRQIRFPKLNVHQKASTTIKTLIQVNDKSLLNKIYNDERIHFNNNVVPALIIQVLQCSCENLSIC